MSILTHQTYANEGTPFWNVVGSTPENFTSYIRKSETVASTTLNTSGQVVIATDSFTAPFSGTVVVIASTSVAFTGATATPTFTLGIAKTTPTTASATNATQVPTTGTEALSTILSFPITTGDNVGLSLYIQPNFANFITTALNTSWVIYVCSGTQV